MTATDDAPERVPRWEQRFRAARVSLPDWAQDAPQRSLYVSNVSGSFELYAWDRERDPRAERPRQATSRPQGTVAGALTPDGRTIWWFDDTDGDEYGVWRAQDFDAGARPGQPDEPDEPDEPDDLDEPVAPDLPQAYSAGLALGRDGLAVIGQSDEDGVRMSLLRRLGERSPAPVTVYAHEQDAHVGDLSRDGRLLAIAHSEHGDSRHMALRVLRLADPPRQPDTVADLWDGPGKGLDVLGFSPVEGDPRLLVGHERRGRAEVLVWDPTTGEQTEVHLDLPGEVSAQWYQDGSPSPPLLVEHEHAARSALYRYDLGTQRLEPLDTPRGLVGAATTRPDGSVEFSWSSAAEPPVIRSSTGSTVLAPPGPRPPASVPVEDVWVEGQPFHSGRIHALVSRPVSQPGGAASGRDSAGGPPYPSIFLVHGGPTWQDFDAFAADVAAWADAGFAVVRVNYRGSTGYGAAWRDAIEGRPGLTELEDLAAVRAWGVASGLLDPARIVLAGGSWGGYLTLLGLGTQPDLWSLGIAAVPVADYVAAYEDEMEPLKAFDRSLFGGSPAEVPEVYRRSNPIEYVDSVRVPVLVLAGANDPRCPLRQIENYLARLRERDAAHEVYRYDAGHGSLVVEERIRQMRAELDFARRHLA